MDKTQVQTIDATQKDEVKGQRMVQELLDDCKGLAAAVASRQMLISPTFEATATELADVKGHLEKLSLTQAWSLRETDLFDYLQRLRAVDEKRIDGKFIDAQGKPTEQGQKVEL